MRYFVLMNSFFRLFLFQFMLVLIPTLSSFGQATLKHPIDSLLRLQLMQEALNTFSLNFKFDFNFQTEDLYPTSPQNAPYLIANNDEILRLRGLLKNDVVDAPVNRDLGAIYRRMNDPKNAFKHLTKAIEQYKALAKKEFTNHDHFRELGKLFNQLGNPSGAIQYFQLALELEPKDSVARHLIPQTFLAMGLLDQAQTQIDTNIAYDSAAIDNYVLLATLRFFEFFSKKQAQPFGTSDSVFAQQPLDSLFNLVTFKAKAEQYPKDYSVQQLNRYTRLVALLAKSYYSYDVETRTFKPNDSDLELYKQLTAAWKKTLKKKKIKNRYAIYNALGTIEVLQNRPKQGIPYFEEAIAARPTSESSPTFNAGQAYENLITAQLLLGDTLGAQTTLKKKIKERVTIDPAPGDLSNLARFYLENEQIKEAVNFYNLALTLDSLHEDAHVGLALIHLRDANYKAADQALDKAIKINEYNINTNLILAMSLLMRNDASTSHYVFKKLQALNPNDPTINRLLETYYQAAVD